MSSRIPPRQLAALRTIHQMGPKAKIVDVARELGISAQAATLLLEKLRTKGMLDHKTVTPAGEQALERAA